MDDDFGGDDADFLAVSGPSFAASSGPTSAPRLDRARPVTTNTGGTVQQPKPQALPARNAPTSILVSSRQKGNPILVNIRSLPWEYADIPADFVLGATTCALFLSLKYHRLHPEYIYGRIKDLAGKYNLRILLTMVDIPNHEEPLKELSKTSMINNVTIILCWSAPEAGRYLELYKSYEHAAPTAIRAHQATSYSDKLVEFITVPRSINKTDAVSLISSFGSIRTAMNASPEEVALVPGFGAKKVQRWCNTVREPFRVRKAAKRGLNRDDSMALLNSRANLSREVSRAEDDSTVDERMATGLGDETLVPGEVLAATTDTQSSVVETAAPTTNLDGPHEDEELAMLEAAGEISTSMPNSIPPPVQPPPKTDAGLSDGIAAALARFRQEG